MTSTDTHADLPELNRENAAPGTPLRPYDAVYGEQEIRTYLERTRESIDAYRLDGRVCVPPGILLAGYVRLIHETFFYQTGVHVSSEMVIRRLPWQDEPVRVTGEVKELFQRNGNEYVRFSVNAATPAGEPLVAIEHVSIYRLKPRGDGADTGAAGNRQPAIGTEMGAAGSGQPPAAGGIDGRCSSR